MLSKRLQHIYDLISPACQVVVDIGYDHGLVLHRLIQDRAVYAIGIEQKNHFADQYIARYPQDRIDLRTGDGLEPILDADPAGVLVLTGIGEEQIRRILHQRQEYMQRCEQIVFSVSSHDLQLRPYLNQQGWRADKECIVQERGRLYVLSSFVKGIERCTNRRHCAMGPRLFESQDDLLAEYEQFLNRRFYGADTGGISVK